MNLILASVFVGSMVVTSYRSVPQQTDSSPDYTSIGEKCGPHGIAVSQDLLNINGGPLHYGDELFIEGVGWRTINDTMNVRWHRRMDVWVPTYDAEKRFGVRRLRVWIIKAIEQGDNQK